MAVPWRVENIEPSVGKPARRRFPPVMTSPYLFHLGAAPASATPEGGISILASSENFPVLSGISACAVTLPCGSAEGPRWYANANLLAYCADGEIRVTVLSPGDVQDCFTVGAQELFFVEQGFTYSVVNTASKPAHMIVMLSHERPVAFTFSGLMGAVSPPLSHLRIDPAASGGGPVGRMPDVRDVISSPHKLALRSIAPAFEVAGGTVQVVSSEELSILDRLALCSFRLRTAGVSEPHWHPNCGELGYILCGRGRVSLLSARHAAESFEVGLGDVYYVPPAHPHWLENLGDKDVHVLIGFDHNEPLRIGLQGAMAAFPAIG
jgi:oxalate decarboxylase